LRINNSVNISVAIEQRPPRRVPAKLGAGMWLGRTTFKRCSAILYMIAKVDSLVDATPLEFVTEVSGLTEPPPSSTDQLIVTPETGLFRASRAMTEEERKKATADAEKQLQEMQRPPPVLADYTLFFDDWRDADGVKFPHKMRRAMGADTIEEWTVSKVKVNPKVDPKRFAGES